MKVGAIDPAAFFEGALTEEAVQTDCTLVDGTESTCYDLTIAGFPATREKIGPWCPETTSDPGAGIWFDGEAVYDIDGQFILDLAETYDDPTWKLYDEDGKVLSTDTSEKFNDLVTGGAQTDADPVNRCVYGEIEWVEGGKAIPADVEIPATPSKVDSPTVASEKLGVTLDGVLIENSAPIDLILGNYTIGAFDPCGGHVNPQEGYHMHATTGCSDSTQEVADGETAMFGYAMDGYAIHGPYSEKEEADAGLDECNGHETSELGYHYHANQVKDNAVLTCFSGKTIEAADDGAAAGGPPAGGPPAGGAPAE
ncbi:MAG: YHYH protein [Solirubrobacterales bacterium]